MRLELKGDIDSLRTELKGDMAELKGDIDGLRGEMNKRFANLATSLVRNEERTASREASESGAGTLPLAAKGKR